MSPEALAPETRCAPARAIPYLPPPDEGLVPLYADEHLIAVSKPAGLLSVPGRDSAMQDCLITRVQRHYPHALVVHRLDEDTSGIMLLALHPEVQRQLSQAFADRRVDKHYTALVRGLVAPETGEIDTPIGRDWHMRPLRRIDTVRGQTAHTRFRVITRDAAAGHTQLQLQPLTGRTHQLRVHLMHIGHPILGDRLYGASDATRLMLHACTLRFAHPATQQVVCLDSAPPFVARLETISP